MEPPGRDLPKPKGDSLCKGIEINNLTFRANEKIILAGADTKIKGK